MIFCFYIAFNNVHLSSKYIKHKKNEIEKRKLAAIS